MLVSKKIPSGEESCKDFIAYLYNDNKVNLLHVMLPKTSAFVNSYDGQTKWMYLLIENDYTVREKMLYYLGYRHY